MKNPFSLKNRVFHHYYGWGKIIEMFGHNITGNVYIKIQWENPKTEYEAILNIALGNALECLSFEEYEMPAMNHKKEIITFTFNVGDEVFFVYENKVRKGIINEINEICNIKDSENFVTPIKERIEVCSISMVDENNVIVKTIEVNKSQVFKIDKND